MRHNREKERNIERKRRGVLGRDVYMRERWREKEMEMQ